MKPPVPNRLAQVPSELHDSVDLVLRNDGNHDQTTQIKRLYKVVDIAYGEGYMDGYRDGHTDAGNGHDERITVHLT